MQSGGRHTDHNDLVFEFVRIPFASLAVEIDVQIRIRNMRTTGAATGPAQQYGLRVRHRQADILCDSRRQRWNLPAVRILIYEIAPPDAVLIGEKFYGAEAPVVRSQRLGQSNIQRCIFVCEWAGE